MLLLVAVVAGYVHVKPMLYIYTGFTAKTACSCHYIQDRNIEDIKEHELEPASFINAAFDGQVTTASFLGIRRQAIFHPKLGCTLLSEKSVEDLENRTANNIRSTNSQGLIPSELNSNPALQKVIDAAFEEPFQDKAVNTRAVIVIKDSLILAEKYAEGYGANVPQMGWSMTKSITNALIGILVKQGKLNIHQPAPIEDWHTSIDDPRKDITLDHLLRMSTGLEFAEEYDKASTVNQMLWTKADAGKVAYSQPLAHPVDSVWNYSSGTTNIISHIIRNEFDDYQEYLAFPYKALFDKIGMTNVYFETDANGTHVGSSLMYATPRDWARFGLLYLNDGVWNGERILPEGWVDYSRTPSSTVKPYDFYGAHWWLNAKEEPKGDSGFARHWEGVPTDAYYASGFEGQTVMVIPSLDMVIVRLGQTLDRSTWDIGDFAGKVIEAIQNLSE